jgi:hypothetical protein
VLKEKELLWAGRLEDRALEHRMVMLIFFDSYEFTNESQQILHRPTI